MKGTVVWSMLKVLWCLGNIVRDVNAAGTVKEGRHTAHVVRQAAVESRYNTVQFHTVLRAAQQPQIMMMSSNKWKHFRVTGPF